MLRHHHDARRTLDQMAHDSGLTLRWLTQHGVEGDDQWRRQPIDEIADHFAVGAAENAEFMLQPDRVDVGFVDRPGGFQIGLGLLCSDYLPDIVIGQRLAAVIERIDFERDLGMVFPQLRENVAGKGGNSALARGESADQRDPPDHSAPGMGRAQGVQLHDFAARWASGTWATRRGAGTVVIEKHECHLRTLSEVILFRTCQDIKRFIAPAGSRAVQHGSALTVRELCPPTGVVPWKAKPSRHYPRR